MAQNTYTARQLAMEAQYITGLIQSEKLTASEQIIAGVCGALREILYIAESYGYDGDEFGEDLSKSSSGYAMQEMAEKEANDKRAASELEYLTVIDETIDKAEYSTDTKDAFRKLRRLSEMLREMLNGAPAKS